MMSTAQEAAGRIRRIQAGVEKSQDIYGITFDEHNRQSLHDACRKIKRLMLNDERAIIDAYLADHPADSDEPITTDWLHTTSMEYCDIEKKFFAIDGHCYGHSLTYEAHGVMGWCFVGICLHKQPKTRGELRRLAECLGFELDERK